MTSAKPKTINEVAAPFENYMLAMPGPAPDVCTVCHSSVFNGWSDCKPCNDQRSALGLTADAVASVALAVEGDQLARDLYAYKDARVDSAARQRLVWGLGAVTYKWLHLHEECLAEAAGVGAGRFDVITSVPSTGGREGDHPLVTMLTKVMVGSHERYSHLLAVQRPELGPREMQPDRFKAVGDVPATVLVVDDSWVSGAKPQAAATALKAAGAQTVGILTVGRWFKLGYAPNTEWLKEKRKATWSWDTCCLHPA